MARHTHSTARLYLALIALLAVLLPCALRAGEFSSTNDVGCVLTCNLASNEFVMGEQILMSLSLSNSVDGVVQTSAYPTFGTFKFNVHDNAAGADVAMTSMGKRVHLAKSLSSGKRRPLRLEKGEVFTHQVRLNWLFDMTIPGDYEVTVSTSFGRIQGDEITKGQVSVEAIPVRVVLPE